jgi:hypothetical protein
LFGTVATLASAVPEAGQVASRPAQQVFATPKQAADALVQASESDNLSTLERILGPESEDLLSSEDPVRDKNTAAEFAAKAREKTEVNVDPTNAKRAVLLVGDDGWPLPIPIVERGGNWLFDTKAGRQEMLFGALVPTNWTPSKFAADMWMHSTNMRCKSMTTPREMTTGDIAFSIPNDRRSVAQRRKPK